MVRSGDEGGLKSFIEVQGPAMTQFELSLNVVKNAFEQWVVRCAAAAGIKGFSALELLVLHMVGHKNGSKRIADICFALKIEDSHLVSYALKKLAKADLVESKKIGKDTFFSNTEKGQQMVAAYAKVRQRCLIRSLAMLSTSELDLIQLTDMLRVLSGIYEQAARNAETSV